MKTLKTTRQIGAYIRKKLKSNAVRNQSYSEKGKTHQRMAWMLKYGVGNDADSIKAAKLDKIVAKIQSKLDKSGIAATVYLTTPKYRYSHAKINVKMTLDQHSKIRSKTGAKTHIALS